jgi:hypothetical protein
MSLTIDPFDLSKSMGTLPIKLTTSPTKHLIFIFA